MKAIVSLVRCADYDQAAVDAAVFEACEAALFPAATGKTVLLKPNILIGADPERAVSTHPAVLRAAIRYVKSKGARVLVGESPSFQAGNSAFRKSGLLQAAEEEGAQWVDFSDAVPLDNPSGRIVKSFNVARAAVEADILVSLCKLKNHTLMYFTGAIKNLFGCVPGMQKPQFHMRFQDRRRFGEMLADLAAALKPEFSLMDGIVGMEGPGPALGFPRKVGAVLASRDPLALDRTACRLIGLDPDHVANLADGLTRGAWISSDAEIELRGESVESLRVEGWKQVPRDLSEGHRLPRFLRDALVARPFFSRARCAACRACVEICPAKALELRVDPGARAGKSVRVDYAKCIRCYCCHEVCPEDAIAVRRTRPLGFR